MNKRIANYQFHLRELPQMVIDMQRFATACKRVYGELLLSQLRVAGIGRGNEISTGIC
jgi:hypothetical protein